MSLRTYLKGIADAIREKKGTTDKINAQNFASEIASIETGGGSGGGTTLKNFFDNTKSARCLFYGSSLTNIDGLIEYSDTSSVTNMREIFVNCKSLKTVPLFDTSNVTTMYGMFDSCKSLTTIPQFNTGNVTNMQSMFYECESLTTIPLLDTSKVAEMAYMFVDCSSLTTVPQLDISTAYNINSLFAGCSSLTTVSQLDTSNVTQMFNAFNNCYKLQTIDLISMDKVGSSSSGNMCNNCYSLTKFIIRNMTKTPPLATSSFNNCYHFTGTTNATYNPNGLKDGRIYVPDAMVSTLKSATNWSAYADIIVGLSTL